MDDFTRSGTPISALRDSSIANLSKSLNALGVIDEESGLLNDYRGLAELAGFNRDKIKVLKSKPNPMHELLEAWPEVWAAGGKQVPTVGDLWKCLLKLGRNDVAEKISKSVSRDVKDYESAISNRPAETLEDDSLTYEEEEMKSICLDRNGKQRLFDGFVGNDVEHTDRAWDITQFLEKMLNITLFFTPRDMPPGVALYPAQAYIIEKRCSYLLCLITKDFEKSPSCQFIVRFVNHLSPDGVNKKMIPMIVDRRTQVPNIMQHLKGIDFSDSEVKQYSQHKHWKQLADALKPVNSPRILRKSMSVPVNSVRPQKVRRSISEQDKRSVPVSHSRVSLKMCQEGRKSEVDRIVSTPSDDSKADDEIGQAAGGTSPVDSGLYTGFCDLNLHCAEGSVSDTNKTIVREEDSGKSEKGTQQPERGILWI